MRKIVELAFFTDRVAEMTAFYQRLLEAEPVYAAASIAIFKVEGLTVLIHAKGEAPPGMPPNADHFALGVSNLTEAHQALFAHGLAFDLAPRAYDWGHSAYLRDPDGRLVELSQG